MTPFLVPPKESTSTPRSRVASRSPVLRATAAFEIRAPSRWTSRPFSWAKRDFFGLFGAVHGAQFGGLGDGDDPGLGVVFVSERLQVRPDLINGYLPVFRGDGEEFAPGKLFRGPAFVLVYVGRLGADDRLERVCEGLEGKDVGTCPVVDKKDLCFLSEDFLEPSGGGFGIGIVAVGHHVALVGLHHGPKDLGVHACIVVARKTPFVLQLHSFTAHSLRSFKTQSSQRKNLRRDYRSVRNFPVHPVDPVKGSSF